MTRSGSVTAELFSATHSDALPAVIVIGGAEDGVPSRAVARRLAQAGYAALATAPEEPAIDEFADLLERLSHQAVVDASRICLLGIGSGAQAALQIASRHAAIRAVIAVSPTAATSIALERIGGPILMIAGIDDTRWPSTQYADQIVERLTAHRFTHGVSLHSYGDAGHWLFGAPLEREDPSALRLIELGGTIEGNLLARRDAWRKVLVFLQDSVLAMAAGSARPLVVRDDGWTPG